LAIPTFADPEDDEDDERQTPIAVVGALRAGPMEEARQGPCEEAMKPIGYLLKRVQHSLRLAMDDKLREYELSTPQYAALWALGRESGLSGAELARRCFVRPQTMSEILTNLEGRKLVERKPHPVHRRVVEVHLTQAAVDLLEACEECVHTIDERMLHGLSPQGRHELSEGLRRCAEGLEATGV
jgi:DNA-binding MarR family transcriptional regulator